MPDFDGGKGYHWMKLTKEAIANGTRDSLPHKPKDARVSLAQRCFNDSVERRLSRVVISMTTGISFDENGRIIRDEEGIA